MITRETEKYFKALNDEQTSSEKPVFPPENTLLKCKSPLDICEMSRIISPDPNGEGDLFERISVQSDFDSEEELLGLEGDFATMGLSNFGVFKLGRECEEIQSERNDLLFKSGLCQELELDESDQFQREDLRNSKMKRSNSESYAPDDASKRQRFGLS